MQLSCRYLCIRLKIVCILSFQFPPVNAHGEYLHAISRDSTKMQKCSGMNGKGYPCIGRISLVFCFAGVAFRRSAHRFGGFSLRLCGFASSEAMRRCAASEKKRRRSFVYFTSAAPNARHRVKPSLSGISQQMTLSEASAMPPSAQRSSHERIHSPSPQP